MTSTDDAYDLVSADLYDQTFTDLSQLQTQLPEAVVVSLAREVLDRLARQLKEPKTLDQSVLELAEALVGEDPKAAAVIINQRAQSGVAFNTLYLDHLAPAALMLGTWWEADKVSFAKVTVGTGRIYAIMRTLTARMVPHRLGEEKSAFFAAIPGEDHTLGVKMAADMARKAGWHIDSELDGPHEDLVDQIVYSNHRLIGLSGAGAHSLPNLAKLVLAIRVSAPSARILVSGNVVRAAEHSVRLMHVDGLGVDFDTAMSELDRLWQSLAPADRK